MCLIKPCLVISCCLLEKMAKQLGCDEAFRLIINNGADAGQTVFHLHLHILANKSFEEGQLAHSFW